MNGSECKHCSDYNEPTTSSVRKCGLCLVDYCLGHAYMHQYHKGQDD